MCVVRAQSCCWSPPSTLLDTGPGWLLLCCAHWLLDLCMTFWGLSCLQPNPLAEPWDCRIVLAGPDVHWFWDSDLGSHLYTTSDLLAEPPLQFEFYFLCRCVHRDITQRQDQWDDQTCPPCLAFHMWFGTEPKPPCLQGSHFIDRVKTPASAALWILWHFPPQESSPLFLWMKTGWCKWLSLSYTLLFI